MAKSRAQAKVEEAEAAVDAGDEDADRKLDEAEAAVEAEEQGEETGTQLAPFQGPTDWPGTEPGGDTTQYEEEEVPTTGDLGNPRSVYRRTDRQEEAFAPVDEAGETKPQLILVGTWVRLGFTDNIPEEVQGHEAQVTEAPMKNSDGDEAIPFRHQYQDEDTVFTVRTRDQYSATLAAKREDFITISDRGGRAGLGTAG